MSIQTCLFVIELNPFLAAFIAVIAMIAYVIKRGYDWGRQQMEAKAKQGQTIY